MLTIAASDLRPGDIIETTATVKVHDVRRDGRKVWVNGREYSDTTRVRIHGRKF
ncbi:hypothetical protein [Mycobacterium sp. Root265]|uniref:hypothetical protein n=1 Tax=Mycobacterium sp. Root265 TaxID=1736504 RepID=UPI000AC17210|nr:hypothetical protein [Mycobacterium sp. Root265]